MKKIFLLFCIFGFASSLFPGPSYAAVVVPTDSTTAKAVIPDSATLKSALAAFKSLSRKEKRERLREAKKELKAFRADKRQGNDASSDRVLQIICAIFLPPLGVYLHEGEINSKFWIDLILTLLFFLPGMIYALIVVLGDN
jgi:uncharacterized membrane protein YqaE (UPF0057 family)